MRTDFFYSDDGEPHRTRRQQILEKHPEIEQLYGNDPRVVPYVIATVALQLTCAYFQQFWSWPLKVFICWLVGGTASHALSLMTHEVSHNLVFATKEYNEYFGIFCNVGMGLPSSTVFKRYHMEHHLFQGDHEKDVDLPTYWEGRFFTNTFLKLIWLICQPLFYAFRPMIVRPKETTALDILNTIVVVCSDICVAYFCGISGVLYLICSTLLGMGVHPVAGHFISEHYVFDEGYETYSYYGILNYVCWNVGYHNEHHDFPRVPGWRLPEIKRIAPEFYENLPHHTSWVYVLYRYVTDPKVGPYNRVRRGDKKTGEDRSAPVSSIASDEKKTSKKKAAMDDKARAE